jgi:hypothetical protein
VVVVASPDLFGAFGTNSSAASFWSQQWLLVENTCQLLSTSSACWAEEPANNCCDVCAKHLWQCLVARRILQLPTDSCCL